MARIRVHVDIEATPAQVWEAIADVGSHVLWMHDARAIRFTSGRHQGVGTRFECDTRIGLLRTVDDMEITRWRPRREMGVRHRGMVSGKGAFTLRARRRRRGHGAGRAPVTRFTWSERLRFPWYLGGPFGALAAAPVLRWIWRRNLRTLRRLVESGNL
jgi:Polyketide cyclase / dehydrase and lipid transport